MNRRASCVGTFEFCEAAHVALRTLLAFSQPVNCIFWPIGMLNWLVAASKLHKHRETCCTAEWPFYSFLILCHDWVSEILWILSGSVKIQLHETSGSNVNKCIMKQLKVYYTYIQLIIAIWIWQQLGNIVCSMFLSLFMEICAASQWVNTLFFLIMRLLSNRKHRN